MEPLTPKFKSKHQFCEIFLEGVMELIVYKLTPEHDLSPEDGQTNRGFQSSSW